MIDPKKDGLEEVYPNLMEGKASWDGPNSRLAGTFCSAAVCNNCGCRNMGMCQTDEVTQWMACSRCGHVFPVANKITWS